MNFIKKIFKAIIPDDLALRKRRLELMVWAFVLSLAYYPEYFGFLAWISLVRPIMIISSLKGKDVFKAAFFYSFFLHLFLVYWIALVTLPGVIGAVLLMALYNAVILFAFNRLYHIKKIYGIVMLPFLWVGLEYFRTLTEFSFPWSDLGYTQSYYLYIMQFVSVTSVHGISFLILVVNILLWQILRKEVSIERKLTSFFVSGAIVIMLAAYGWVVVPKYPVPGTINVALLQGSVPLKVKWKKGNAEYSYKLYDSLATSVSDSSVKLYVWPETSAPTYLSHDYAARKTIGETAKKTKAFHLVGALGASDVNGSQRYFNSCYQFSPDGKLDQRCDKIKLVPFSEHVPYQNYLPFLEKAVLKNYLTFIEQYNIQWWSDFYPGDSIVLFNLPDYSYASLICFESAFPEFVRETIHKGADFIVGITNDTWFGTSVGIHQHSRIFLTRAIENRCWGIRVANSGLTYIVDNYGRIRNELDVYEVAVLTGQVDLLDGRSFFNKHGDIVGRISFLITLSIIGILILLWFSKKYIIKNKY